MPFKNVTDTILTEENQEMKEMIASNCEAKEAYEQFEAEYKLRRELIQARKQNKITQAELKEKTGLTQQFISRIETNYDISPSLKNLIKYVNAIGYELVLQPKQK